MVCLFLPALVHAAGDVDWQELKGEHFIVYYRAPNPDKGDESVFPAKLLDTAERYYIDIASDLGYSRTNFWTWENRVKIYIYPDRDSYRRGTGAPEWSQGLAEYNKKQISSYTCSEDFLDSILPHEITHLIFRDFIGFKGRIPLWVDEGVAQWEEKPLRQAFLARIRELYDRDMLLSIHDMLQLDIYGIKQADSLYLRSIQNKKGARGVLFLTGDNLLKTYYLQAVSLIDFLVSSYGSGDFVTLCRQLRDGASLAEALRTTFHIRDYDEFELLWRKYLMRMYGEQ